MSSDKSHSDSESDWEFVDTDEGHARDDTSPSVAPETFTRETQEASESDGEVVEVPDSTNELDQLLEQEAQGEETQLPIPETHPDAPSNPVSPPAQPKAAATKPVPPPSQPAPKARAGARRRSPNPSQHQAPVKLSKTPSPADSSMTAAAPVLPLFSPAQILITRVPLPPPSPRPTKTPPPTLPCSKAPMAIIAAHARAVIFHARRLAQISLHHLMLAARHIQEHSAAIKASAYWLLTSLLCLDCIFCFALLRPNRRAPVSAHPSYAAMYIPRRHASHRYY